MPARGRQHAECRYKTDRVFVRLSVFHWTRSDWMVYHHRASYTSHGQIVSLRVAAVKLLPEALDAHVCSQIVCSKFPFHKNSATQIVHRSSTRFI